MPWLKQCDACQRGPIDWPVVGIDLRFLSRFMHCLLLETALFLWTKNSCSFVRKVFLEDGLFSSGQSVLRGLVFLSSSGQSAVAVKTFFMDVVNHLSASIQSFVVFDFHRIIPVVIPQFRNGCYRWQYKFYSCNLK